MNKILIRFAILSVAVVLLLLILFKSRLPFGKRNSSFSTDPLDDITRVELSEGGKKLFLVKEGEEWLINGKTETRKSGILFMLKILREIKIKSPVSSGLFKTEITGKSIVPVKVKVYKKRKLLKSFLVYKTISNSYGNIMKMNEGSKPFIVYMPDYEGNIGYNFSVNELFWQPNIVMKLLPSEITSVEFENFVDTASSFSIVIRNNRYFLSDRIREISGWDSVRIRRYLSYFAYIPFESWAFEIGEGEQKMVESQQPLYRIIVNTNAGSVTELTLWERIANDNNVKTKDTDRLLGKTRNSDELFILRYFDIDPLLKKRSYFFQE
jgi:hypothetical protein